MTTTPSPDGGATPATGPTPAKGGASTGAMPAASTVTTLEEAIARIAELERHAASKEGQANRHGQKLSEAEKELAAYKEKERLAQEATLSEAEKTNRRLAEAEARYQQEHKQHIKAIVQLAASKKGIIDPDLAALAIEASLEFDEGGMPSNLDRALDDLIKNKPYLAAKPTEQQPASPAQTTPRPPQVPAMNPGRATIAPAQPQGPFQPTRLTDVFKRP